MTIHYCRTCGLANVLPTEFCENCGQREIAPESVLDMAKLRALFEAKARDSHGFKRSRKGTYTNPATARDWKWFVLGAQANDTK